MTNEVDPGIATWDFPIKCHVTKLQLIITSNSDCSNLDNEHNEFIF